MVDTSTPVRTDRHRQVAATRTLQALTLALATVGALSADGVVIRCPICGKGDTTAPVGKKFKMFPDGGFKHFSSNGCSGDALNVLTANGVPFGDAVAFLNGKPTRTRLVRPRTLPTINASASLATPDFAVYHGVIVYGRNTGGIAAAVAFYGQWGISAEAVERYGAVYITNPAEFEQAAIAEYGIERLLACGLFYHSRTRGPHSLISDNFPAVEAHRHPGGREMFLQFRASDAQHKRYLDHKAGKRAYEGSQKFLAIRGAATATQIGCGLDVIHADKPDTVYVREGYKDTLADYTLGRYAYGMPTANYRPPDIACEVLKNARHVRVGIDNDAAGNAHQEAVVTYLRSKGVNASAADVANPESEEYLAPGCDVTNMLDRMTHAGV